MTSNYHMSVFFSKCCVHRKHQKENVPNINWLTTLGAHGPSFPMPLWYGTGAGTYEKKQELPDENFCCHGMSSGRRFGYDRQGIGRRCPAKISLLSIEQNTTGQSLKLIFNLVT